MDTTMRFGASFDKSGHASFRVENSGPRILHRAKSLIALTTAAMDKKCKIDFNRYWPLDLYHCCCCAWKYWNIKYCQSMSVSQAQWAEQSCSGHCAASFFEWRHINPFAQIKSNLFYYSHVQIAVLELMCMQYGKLILFPYFHGINV